MSKLVAAATAGAAVAAAVALLWRRRRWYSRTGPVLCFGDSLTEGYTNVWHHPTFAPTRKDPTEWPDGELDNLRFHPYSIHLGSALAGDAGVSGAGYDVALQYAVCRAYSGWKAPEMLAALEAALASGPYRCAVVLAGSNDIVQGASAEETLPHVLALHEACDRAGVPVVVVPNTDCDMQHHGQCTAPERQRAALTRLAALIEERADAAGRTVADARSAMPMDDEHAHLWDDSIHPSPAGQKTLAAVVLAAMRKHGL